MLSYHGWFHLPFCVYCIVQMRDSARFCTPLRASARLCTPLRASARLCVLLHTLCSPTCVSELFVSEDEPFLSVSPIVCISVYCISWDTLTLLSHLCIRALCNRGWKIFECLSHSVYQCILYQLGHFDFALPPVYQGSVYQRMKKIFRCLSPCVSVYTALYIVSDFKLWLFSSLCVSELHVTEALGALFQLLDTRDHWFLPCAWILPRHILWCH